SAEALAAYERAAKIEDKFRISCIDFCRALVGGERAAKIDAAYAELVFVRAQIELGLGQISRAEGDFQLARDLDALRFRADSQINRIIREVATRYNAPLVDAEEEIGRASRVSPREEMFYDHVHFTFAGNYRVALLFAAAIETHWPGKPSPTTNWLSETEVAQRLAFTDFDRNRVGEEMRARLQQPPFSSQSNFRERDQHWQEML